MGEPTQRGDTDIPRVRMCRVHQDIGFLGHEHRRNPEQQALPGARPLVADLPALGRWRSSAPFGGEVAGRARQLGCLFRDFHSHGQKVVGYFVDIDVNQVFEGRE